MILAIDIGNTHTVIGGIDAEKTRFVERVSTDRNRTDLEYAVLLRNALNLHGITDGTIEGAIVSSVVPPVTQAIRGAVQKVLGITPMQVSAGMKSGMNIRMDNPASVGSDLIADAVGALSCYPAPLIIFDFGTASTVSVIDRDRNYIGGMIFPGAAIMITVLALNLFEGDKDIDAAAARFIRFCEENNGKTVDRMFIEAEYADCTPQYIAQKILECLEK